MGSQDDTLLKANESQIGLNFVTWQYESVITDTSRINLLTTSVPAASYHAVMLLPSWESAYVLYSLYCCLLKSVGSSNILNRTIATFGSVFKIQGQNDWSKLLQLSWNWKYIDIAFFNSLFRCASRSIASENYDGKAIIRIKIPWFAQMKIRSLAPGLVDSKRMETTVFT